MEIQVYTRVKRYYLILFKFKNLKNIYVLLMQCHFG